MDNSSKTGTNFASIYPQINKMVLDYGEVEPSRYGQTIETLGFKTVVTDPISRCVGGQKRDINVFFLLAEALWIWTGRADVKFLTIFNSRMSEFSDDGETFHAPYGFRLRHYGKESTTEELPLGLKNDQVRRGIELLKDKETRRCVLSIWNPNFDLFSTKPTKDIPCNDLLMFKVRKNKLHLSVLNRSNDLHWGLPTNIFQFSFTLEVLAGITGVEVGCERHFSDSLHIYTDNPVNKIHETVASEYQSMNQTTLYELVKSCKMDFGFEHMADGEVPLEHVDEMFAQIIDLLTESAKDEPDYSKVKHDKVTNSKYFLKVFEILKTYVDYTKSDRKEDAKLKAIFKLCGYQEAHPAHCNDYFMLALNWFHSRLKSEDAVQASLSQILLLNLNPELANTDYSLVGRL